MNKEIKNQEEYLKRAMEELESIKDISSGLSDLSIGLAKISRGLIPSIEHVENRIKGHRERIAELKKEQEQ